MFEEIDRELKEKASELLESGAVDVVIGYRAGTLPLRSTPHFAFDPDEAGEFVFDRTCNNNLSVYLGKFKGKKVGLVAKGCDARSAIALAVENQFPREDVVLIGIPCPGVIDHARLRSRFGERISKAHIESDEIIITVDGREERFPLKEFIAGDCLSCDHPFLDLCDIKIGKEGGKESVEATSILLAELEGTSPEERWDWFRDEFSRCNLCYACREACPACYCELCFVDRDLPRWQEKSGDISDVLAFHLVRALHSAGRCVGCGACERACPQGIRLRPLTEKAMRTAEEDFCAEPGLDLEEVPALATFSEEDPGDFIL